MTTFSVNNLIRSFTLSCLVICGVFSAGSHQYALGRENSFASAMYSSERAADVGDLVTVIIDQSSSLNKDQSMNTSKESNADVSTPQIGADSEWLTSKLEKITPMQLSGSSEYSGTGSKSSSSSFNTEFATRVVDVLPNSTLLIQGDREVMLDGELVNMTMSGLVRPRDVRSDNTVLSSKVADARIQYKNTGDLSDGSKPGWLWQFFQFINPF